MTSKKTKMDDGDRIELCKKKCESLAQQLSRIETSLTSESLLEMDEAALTVRLDQINLLETRFDSAQSYTVGDEDGDEPRVNFTSTYLDIKTKLTRQLNALRTAAAARSSTMRQGLFEEQPSFIINTPKPRLPTLQIPKFSGTYTEWPDFYSMFKSIVDGDADLTKIEKFQHLRSSLRDAAMDTIRSLEINERNYDKALELLKNRFDNKRLNFQAHVRDIFLLNNVEGDSVVKLRELSDQVNSHLRALQTMGTKDQLADCLLIHLISQKLDVASQTKWEEATPASEIPTWKSMSAFLEKRCQRLENVEYALVTKTPSKQVGKPNSRKALVVSFNGGCMMCNSSGHTIHHCEKFVGLTPLLRYKEAKRLQLCLNCLKKGHVLKSCKSSCCRLCSLKHHTLLHQTSAQSSPTVPVLSPLVSPSADSALTITSLASSMIEPSKSSRDFVILATAIIFVKNRVGSLIPCRALLDSASQLNFITNRLLNQLQLKKCKSTTVISGIGQANFISDHIVDLQLSSRIGEYNTSLTAVVTPTITDDQPSYSLKGIDWNIPSNICLADPQFFESQRIDLLIGASLFFDLLCVGQIRLGEALPILQKTKLGWIVSGGGNGSPLKSSCFAIAEGSKHNDFDHRLDDLVQRFWEVESFCDSLPIATPEELQCEQHFIDGHIRMATGEYSVRLPMKLCPSQLGDSYQHALCRFKNLEKRLIRNPELKKEYTAFIEEYIKLKHMSPITSLSSEIPTYFLPHHCVVKADSSTTKLRVVFDGSASTSSGYSLNEILMAGPTIQRNLFDTLLQFRSFKVAITGDICKMYRCVRMSYPDNFLQCILWRNNPDENIELYKLDTVTYGTKPASFLSIRTMHQLATDEGHAYPIGAKIVRRDFYVDDMTSGGASVEEVCEILKQTTSLLEKGNFKLRKWCSNDRRVLSHVAEADKEKLLKFHDGTDVTKTLGLVWEPNVDVFLFSFTPTAFNGNATKRSILSTVARFYDPLGLIGPVITKAKIFLQHLWREKLNWDESLPQALQSTWSNICDEYKFVDRFSLDRYVLIPGADLEIHGFCDASLAAYGACVFIRAKYHETVRTTLLCSKSRVAPLKTLTVPKLELSAALLLAELLSSISNMAIFDGKFHCWSDSTIVLSWVHAEPSQYNIFVSNRISKIQSLTKGMIWHYVPTEMNPADILSKGSSPKDLINCLLWSHGPTFLEGSQHIWPVFPTLCVDLPEKRKKAFVFTTIDLTFNNKFVNSFEKMQKIYAYVHRFCSMPRKSGPLAMEDIQQGTVLLIRMAQKVSLAKGYKSLESNQKIGNGSAIHSLNPFMDASGLMRVGGRLHNSSLSYESKHPIILPKKHPLTDSIINHFHHKMLHAGPQSLLATIRLQYWPIGGRISVSRVVNKCIRCFRTKPKLMEHIMGSLPMERVQANRAFLVSGVDFCGPLFYKHEVRNRSPVKCYVCLFICFATKAVHLELVKDLTTSSFLAALHRFISTRGRPRTIWSDNATNFVGAKNELKELRQLFLSDSHVQAVHQHCLQDGIDWQFIPPRSPHFGGLWEASIKIFKFHFWRVVGLSTLNFEELRTLVCQISAIINSRPLCPITENPNDLEVLTPAHFLIGAPFTSVVEPDVSALNIGRLGRWQRVCYMQQHFWKNWHTEYLTLLQQRQKWRSTTSNLRVGSMVLIKDENLPPLKWPLARVIEVTMGDDGVVRVAVLKTSSGIVKRGVKKLCLLPINNDTVESLKLPRSGACSDKQ